MSANDLDKALSASPVLGLLSAQARSHLAASGSALTLEPGALLCQQGDPGDAVFVLLEGEVEIRTSSIEGVQVRFASFEAGAVVGEMAALDGGVRSTDMVAVRRSRLWRIPRGPLIAALTDEPKAAVALVAELAGRLRIANASLEAMRTLDLGGRLARLLLETIGARGLAAMTQTEIARRLGASREKVNRKLNAWARQDWVELSPAGIRVIEREALAELVGAAPQS
ncbi:MAG TPA: Crp/Fnr family transcriptional regulator [Caulobacteraceae bacterium]|jgi:CRP-like cAMP-binding protein